MRGGGGGNKAMNCSRRKVLARIACASDRCNAIDKYLRLSGSGKSSISAFVSTNERGCLDPRFLGDGIFISTAFILSESNLCLYMVVLG